MNKRLMLMFVLVALSVAGLSTAQERKAVDKASPKLFVGRVTQVDEQTKAVTLQGKSEKLTLNFSNPRMGTCPAGRKPAWTGLPKIGDVLIARYSSDCDECLATC